MTAISQILGSQLELGSVLGTKTYASADLPGAAGPAPKLSLISAFAPLSPGSCAPSLGLSSSSALSGTLQCCHDENVLPSLPLVDSHLVQVSAHRPLPLRTTSPHQPCQPHSFWRLTLPNLSFMVLLVYNIGQVIWRVALSNPCPP